MAADIKSLVNSVFVRKTMYSEALVSVQNVMSNHQLIATKHRNIIEDIEVLKSLTDDLKIEEKKMIKIKKHRVKFEIYELILEVKKSNLFRFDNKLIGIRLRLKNDLFPKSLPNEYQSINIIYVIEEIQRLCNVNSRDPNYKLYDELTALSTKIKERNYEMSDDFDKEIVYVKIKRIKFQMVENSLESINKANDADIKTELTVDHEDLLIHQYFYDSIWIRNSYISINIYILYVWWIAGI